MEKHTHQLVDHFFRHEYGRLVSSLTRKFSTDLIDLIEDAVQEALLKASGQWAFQKLPDNPFGWLFQVAQNYIIDQFRKNHQYEAYRGFVLSEVEGHAADVLNEVEAIQDDLLKMIFACCHPAISETDQIILSLKLLCGLSVHEIARGLLKGQEAVKKSLTRAKKRFKSSIDGLQIPQVTQLEQRLEVVMKVLYLMFSEGYTATEGDRLLRKDICAEAIRLGTILFENELLQVPSLAALLSLMHFKSARFESRIDKNGNLLILEDQDRSHWEKRHIVEGFDYLMQSKSGEVVSRYHLEAGIESYYISAASYQETDWNAILELYNYLLKINPSPAVQLNRLVVLAEVKGCAEVLPQLVDLENDPHMAKNHLLYAIKADLLIKAGDFKSAVPLLKKSMTFTQNNIEKKFLSQKLAKLV